MKLRGGIVVSLVRKFEPPDLLHPMSQNRDMGHPVSCGWSDVCHPPVIEREARSDLTAMT
jgi:hypothetical protein